MNLHAYLYSVFALLLLAAAACGWIERRITAASVARNYPPVKCDSSRPAGKRWH